MAVFCSGRAARDLNQLLDQLLDHIPNHIPNHFLTPCCDSSFAVFRASRGGFHRVVLHGAARSVALLDFIARREAPRFRISLRGAQRRAVGFHCAARSAALSDFIARREAPRCLISLRGAKRRAVALRSAARSAALSDFSARREAPREVTATSHPPPTLYPRPQAGGLLILM